MLTSRIATAITPIMLVTGTPIKYGCDIFFFRILLTSFMVAHPAMENPPINRRKYSASSIEPENDITPDTAPKTINALMMFLELLVMFSSR